jgi:moderate conductance mechanosensitive channel
MDFQSSSEYLHVSKELLHVIVILVLAWILGGMSNMLIRVFRNYMNTRAGSAEDNRRIETLARVFRYVFTVVITLMAGMLVLSELGISIAPILGAAGVVGLAIGFGAQSLVKDYFNGIFLLLENQIRHGDVVEVCSKSGVVEDITLRYICLRDYEGSVHYISNGLITTVTNKSRGHAYAVIDVNIAYRENVDEVCKVMARVAKELRGDKDLGARILDDLDIAGIEEWGDSALTLRCRFKTVPLEQWGIRRAFLGRLKKEFDELGIEIPYPHLTIYAGQDKQGHAPAFRLVTTRDQ